MKNLLRFWFSNYLFYLILFLIFKLAFCIIYIPFNYTDIINVCYNGLILDISASAHSTIFPTVLLVFSFFTGKTFLKKSLTVFAILFIFINSLLFVSDLELYRHWGFRMDASILQYIVTPGEALASVSTLRVILLFLLVIIITTGLSYIYYRLLIKRIDNDKKTSPWNIPVFLFAGSLLLIPIRGGFSIQPINIGNVYFSNNTGLNHAAENLFWKMGFTLINTKSKVNPYTFFSKTETLDFSGGKNDPGIILNTRRPNIIIIILESYTAKIIETCGGLEGITPYFNRLAREGILFDNFYSSGERTDKGLISILSGYPSQPDNAIMKYPQKTEKLPQLSKDLSKAGYYTSFVYGGDLNFASMNSYILQGNYDKIISEKDFTGNESRTKFGINDHILFNRLFSELNSMPSPFFTVCLTLSNHEPFDVPVNIIKDRKDETDELLNAASYTDLCLGKFMNDCKKQAWYKNTLFIFVSDHGHILPDFSAAYSEDRFHIPMLLTGDVLVKKDTVISSLASQTDIAKTLLNQLGIISSAYYFSSDILNSGYIPHAFYLYNNGFGMMDRHNRIIFDNSSRTIVEYKGDSAKNIITEGKKMMQWTYGDFVTKEFGK